MDRKRRIELLLRAAEVSRAARESGNTPFGALLADAEGRILLEQGNVELTGRDATGHAETALARAASARYDKAFLRSCWLVTTAEPCAMCAGALYWSGIGGLVYGISERRLLELTGSDERNPTLDLPCREVFARGQRGIIVHGPHEEAEAAIVAVHEGYWSVR